MQYFDFDMWSRLAESAPQEFEQLRSSEVEKVILSAVNVRRMRGLQFRIDLERVRARTPMKSCLRLYSLTWDSFLELRDAGNMAFNADYSSDKAAANHCMNAKIIQFPSVK